MDQIEQGTTDWFDLRKGKVTASRIVDVMAKVKSGGEAAGRRNYKAQLAVERLTGFVEESFSNAAMQWGTDQEPAARDIYSFLFNREVEEVGFVPHPTILMAGASPDGLVGEDGLIEIKCPNTATHIDYLLTGKIPEKYILQMQFQLACTGRAWCDFVSYDPRMPTNSQVLCIRVNRNQAKIAEIEREVTVFLNEVSAMVDKLISLGDTTVAA